MRQGVRLEPLLAAISDFLERQNAMVEITCAPNGG